MQNKAEQPAGIQQKGAINLGGCNWEEVGFTGSTHGSNHRLWGEKKVPLGDEERNWAGKEQGSVTSPALASLQEDKYSYKMHP